MFTSLEETVCKFSVRFNYFPHQELSPAVESNTNVNSCFASISIIYFLNHNVQEVRILSSSHVGLRAGGTQQWRRPLGVQRGITGRYGPVLAGLATTYLSKYLFNTKHRFLWHNGKAVISSFSANNSYFEMFKVDSWTNSFAFLKHAAANIWYLYFVHDLNS